MSAPLDIDPTPIGAVRRATVWLSRAVSFLAYVYILAVEAILALGFLLLLGGANPSTPFVEWVYRSLDRAMRPFRGIFEPIELGVTGNDVPSVFETSVLFAMVVYAIVAIVVHAILQWLNGRLDRFDREAAEYRHQQLVARALADRSTGTSDRQPATPPPPTALSDRSS